MGIENENSYNELAIFLKLRRDFPHKHLAFHSLIRTFAVGYEEDIVPSRILRQWPVRTCSGSAQGFRGKCGGDNTRLADASKGGSPIHP